MAAAQKAAANEGITMEEALQGRPAVSSSIRLDPELANALELVLDLKWAEGPDGVLLSLIGG